MKVYEAMNAPYHQRQLENLKDDLGERLNDLQTYLDKYETNLMSDSASSWLKGYDQRIREEVMWLRELLGMPTNDN